MAKIPGMKKYAQLRPWTALWQHRTTLMRMFREMYRGTYKASLLTVLALIGTAIYIVVPVDLIRILFPSPAGLMMGLSFIFF
jgi:uncharacterized membrane protein YkvA (DUF1232 family)